MKTMPGMPEIGAKEWGSEFGYRFRASSSALEWHLFEDVVLVLRKPDRDGVIHWEMRLVVWCSEGLGVRG